MILPEAVPIFNVVLMMNFFRTIPHEIEEAALKKETDALSQERLQGLRKELSDMREQFHEMQARWENEKKHQRSQEKGRKR